MQSSLSIHIRATPETVFAAVCDLSRWPVVLPHYRFVKSLGEEGGREVVRMAATRAGLPISWVSAYEADAGALELRFEHLRAWTKGMQVVWTLTPMRDGTQVEIVHELEFRVRALAWLVEPILGGFFIDPIATQTLAVFKRHIEAAAGLPMAEAGDV